MPANETVAWQFHNRHENYSKDLTHNMDLSRNNTPQVFKAFKHISTLCFQLKPLSGLAKMFSASVVRCYIRLEKLYLRYYIPGEGQAPPKSEIALPCELLYIKQEATTFSVCSVPPVLLPASNYIFMCKNWPRVHTKCVLQIVFLAFLSALL